MTLAEQIDNTPYDFLFRTTADGILIATADKIVSHINPAAAAMLGKTVEETLGKSSRHAFARNPALVNLFLREGFQILDVRLPKQRLALGIAATITSGERIIILQDVTEKRALESRREALSKTIRHDLRNPISAISGFADLLVDAGELNEKQERFLRRIQQTASKLYDVVGTIVDLAWIEAGMPLAHRPMRMSTIIDKAVAELESSAKEHKIAIAVSIQNPMPVVMGDPERLQLVIHHLLQNAIVYSPPDHSIAIHAWSDNHETYCSVADQGVGIADEELDLVFDRMYRSRKEDIRDMPGGGLGLTLAKTIINRHGGDIWASSNPGGGSTFMFVLPTEAVETG